MSLRTRARPAHHEESEQQALLDWACHMPSGLSEVIVDDAGTWNMPIRLSRFLIAIPNGSYLGGTTGQRAFQMARLKLMGLRLGASDLLLALPRGRFHGKWIEMKKQRGQFKSPSEIRRAVSEEQLKFGADMEMAGYSFSAAFGFEEARAAIEAYMAESPHMRAP